jgi:5'-nucleotidase
MYLLDAGDIFQGTPYFNKFGGEVEFKTISSMKCDASTMGNRDLTMDWKAFINNCHMLIFRSFAVTMI